MAWTSGIWPAYEHPRDVHAQMVDCINALTERRTAIGMATVGLDAYIITTSEHRQFERCIDALKSNILVPIDSDYYLDNSQLSGGTFNTWFDSSNELPFITLDRACEVLNLPTNILEYYEGPYRMDELSGLGGNNYDIANVGHSHGYETAFTAAGGTYFPAGRSAWYTTDYGWDAIKRLLDLMLWTGDDSNCWTDNFVSRMSGTQYGVSWADAKPAAEASDLAGSDDGSYTTGVRFGVGDYSASYLYSKWKFNIDSLTTTISKKVDFYKWASHVAGYTPWTFDGLSTGLRDDVFSIVTTDFDLGMAASGTTGYYGQSAITTWCEEPIAGSAYKARGFYLGNVPGIENETKAAVKWGFTYV